jgi:hypothetical protein
MPRVSRVLSQAAPMAKPTLPTRAQTMVAASPQPTAIPPSAAVTASR